MPNNTGSSRVAIDFSEECIQKLFGNEAAEDEDVVRLKQYYFKGDIYQRIHNDLSLRVLVGHKGIGKSATFKISCAENIEKGNIAISLKPDDIMELCNSDSSFLQMIRDWKNGLSEIIFQKVLAQVGLDSDTQISKAVNLAGRLVSQLTEVFSDFIKETADITPIRKSLITSFLRKKKIFVYIDDLDRGWEGDAQSIKRISALLNAARDLTNDNSGLCIRISLRSDVYFLVRTSDESTDKIEGSVIWYTWNQQQIFVMLAKRVLTYFGENVDEKDLIKKPQFELAKIFYRVFEPVFEGEGKWRDAPVHKVLASMIRRRPRDLVKLCTMAARSARSNHHSKVDTDDLRDNFDCYSQERIQDTINEYKSELPEIERLLMGMRPSKREKVAADAFVYSTIELIDKLKALSSCKHFTFSKGSIASPEELAAFLYKINFLVARKKEFDSECIDRRYFEDHKYLSNNFVDFGYQWEVHPAFRWALYPDAGIAIFNNLRLDNEV